MQIRYQNEDLLGSKIVDRKMKEEHSSVLKDDEMLPFKFISLKLLIIVLGFAKFRFKFLNQ